MQKLSRQGFADEVNRRLQAHPSYQRGNRIRLYPDGSTEESAKGYGRDYWGNGETVEQRDMFDQVEAQVRSEFDAPWGLQR